MTVFCSRCHDFKTIVNGKINDVMTKKPFKAMALYPAIIFTLLAQAL